MRVFSSRGLLVFLALLAALGSVAPAEEPREYRGRTIAQVLEDLRSGGLNIVFTDALVKPDMLVLKEPRSEAPRSMLDEILAPHGLTTRPGPADRLVVVRKRASPTVTLSGTVEDSYGKPLLATITGAGMDIEVETAGDGTFEFELPAGDYSFSAEAPGYLTQRIDGVRLRGGRDAVIEFHLLPLVLPLESMLVRPAGREGRNPTPVVPTTVDARELRTVPRFGDDPLRSIERLPGTATTDLQPMSHVRGGRLDQTLLVLDGVELHDPFHLQDLRGGLFGIVDERVAGRVDLFPGGFPVQYGNSTNAVVEMSSPSHFDGESTGFTLATHYARLFSQGHFNGGRGEWFVSARRGYPRSLLPDPVADELYDPRYYDMFSKVSYEIGPRHTVSANLLVAANDTEDSVKDLDTDLHDLGLATEYENRNSWITLDSFWSARTQSRTVVSVGRVARDRSIVELDTAAVRDGREFRYVGLRQDWNRLLGKRHHLSFGFDVKKVDMTYDYATLEAGEDPGKRTYADRVELAPSGEEYSFYLSETFRPSQKVSAEFGLRWDRETYSGLSRGHLSPRFNLAVSPTSRDAVRLYWGDFHQLQRIYELQVEDGVRAFLPGETARQLGLSYTRALPGNSQIGLAVYQTTIDDPRPRFENALDPVTLFPEVQDDRVLIAPERVESAGVELSWTASLGRNLRWRTAYTYSRADDVIDGRSVPRSWDQRHALSFWVNYDLNERWNFNLAGNLHTGWPTTATWPLRITDEDGTPVVGTGFGERNGARMPDYRRFDLRIQRDLDPGPGRMLLFVDITNLTNRRNACCTQDFDTDPGEPIDTLPEPYEYGLRRTVAFGLTWAF